MSLPIKDYSFKKGVKKASQWLDTSPEEVVMVKIRTLKVGKIGLYEQFLISDKYYQKLLSEWIKFSGKTLIAKNPLRVVIDTTSPYNMSFPKFKLLFIARSDGPELWMNTLNKLALADRVPEIAEYVSELIETLAKEKESPDFYNIEMTSERRHVSAGYLTRGDINPPDREVRSLCEELPNMGIRMVMAKPTTMRESISKEKGRITSEINLEIEEKYFTYEILYGTCRQKDTQQVWNKYYTSKNALLEMGTCKISIPFSHKEKGILERPSWFSEMLFGESPEKHFVILNIIPRKEQKFIDVLKEKLAKTDNGDALIFIHGFNVDFAEAARRTAQLGYDLSFKGPVLLFSWPSQGKAIDYIADMNAADYAVLYLKEFLEKIIATSSIKKLHLIAHSMGNVVLTKALDKLFSSGNILLPKINKVILAAPDIDKAVFEQQIAPGIIGIDKPHYTLYASSKDKALKLSQKLRKNLSRLGQGGENLYLQQGMDSIDASSVDTDMLGHGYFAETKLLIDDIHELMDNKSPDERKLKRLVKNIGNSKIIYWKF